MGNRRFSGAGDVECRRTISRSEKRKRKMLNRSRFLKFVNTSTVRLLFFVITFLCRIPDFFREV